MNSKVNVFHAIHIEDIWLASWNVGGLDLKLRSSIISLECGIKVGLERIGMFKDLLGYILFEHSVWRSAPNTDVDLLAFHSINMSETFALDPKLVVVVIKSNFITDLALLMLDNN